MEIVVDDVDQCVRGVCEDNRGNVPLEDLRASAKKVNIADPQPREEEIRPFRKSVRVTQCECVSEAY